MEPSAADAQPESCVLVVEDSATQAIRLRHLLEQDGYSVAIAGDGEAALARMAQRRPILVISDIVMPRMDGYSLCRRIKSDAALRQVPVVLLTSLSDPQDVIRGLEVGADAFAIKPYADATLLARIRSILHNRGLDDVTGSRDSGKVFFAGKEHTVTAKARQILEFLLYTYEDAVERNRELLEARDLLELANRALENHAEQLRQKNDELEEDLRLARDLQHALLPREFPCFPPGATPARAALQFTHVYRPSTTLGGDFCTVLAVAPTRAGIFICDVVGHGVRAALVTALIRGLVEDLVPSANNPGHFMTELNRCFGDVLPPHDELIFASAFFGVIDIVAGTITCANAGHPSPLRFRREPPAVIPLENAPGSLPQPALGVHRDRLYHSHTAPLVPGDMVLLFTDGLFEAENPQRAAFGVQRVADILLASQARSTPERFDQLLAALSRFTGRDEREDDICLLGVELVRLADENDARDASEVPT